MNTITKGQINWTHMNLNMTRKSDTERVIRNAKFHKIFERQNIKYMKKFTLIITMAILELIFLYGIGFSQTQSESIYQKVEGVWRMDKTKTIMNVKANDKIKIDEMSESVKADFDNSVQSRVYRFNRDKSFLATWDFKGKAQSVSGKWEILGDGSLRIIFPNEEKKYYVIIDDESLELTPHIPTEGLFHKLFFTRSN